MFSVAQYGVLLRAVSTYMPAKKHADDRKELAALRTLLAKLVLGEGLLPPPTETPTGTPPPAAEVRTATVATLFPPLAIAFLNAIRSLPPVWIDLEAGLGCAAHVAVEIANKSHGAVKGDKLARIVIHALTQLPDLSPELREHIERTQLVGVQNAPGGEG